VSAPRPDRGQVWCLVVLAAAQLIYSLDLNIVFVALPKIGAGLDFSDQSLQWVIGSYAVFAGGFLLLGGRAADRLGRRRVFITALAIYGASSLAGGLATDPAMIVGARAVQGFGGALLLPATLSLIATLFAEGPERNRALAVWGGTGASGLAVGALLGGVLTQAFGWRAVFFVNVPMAALVAGGALAVVSPDPPSAGARGFDLPGAATVTGGATLIVFAIVQGPVSGWGSIEVVLAAVLSLVLFAAFAVIEIHSADPLMPLGLLANRNLLTAVGVTFVYMGTFGALPYFLTILFQQVHGMGALQTGLAFVVPALAIAVGTQLGERLTTRVGARAALLTGFAIGILGTAILVPAFGLHADYGVALPGLIVSGVGQGIVWTAMWIAAGSAVDPERQGVANGLASTSLNLGYAIGLAVLVAVSGLGSADRQDDIARALSHDSGVAVIAATACMLLGPLLVLVALRGGHTDDGGQTASIQSDRVPDGGCP
jgi:MFS family permease